MTNQKHLNEESFAKRFTDDFSEFFHLSIPEIAYIMGLAALIIFFTTLIFVRVEVSAELDPSFKIPKEIVQHYGLPFDNLRMIYGNPHNETFGGHMSIHPKTYVVYNPETEIAGSGLFINFIIYAVISFIIVKALMKIKEEIDYYRSS
jgi:hypothetical protein